MTDNLITFYKYHGAGNDFIMFDYRGKDISVFNILKVQQLCDRRFGIGADGLILLTDSKTVDFKMIYFNSDGREGTMCGNGGRCITAFAKKLGIIDSETIFEGIDGLHEAKVLPDSLYAVKMIDVKDVQSMDDGDYLNTGSDHFVIIRNSVKSIDVFNEGRDYRNQERFGKTGTNVNFVELLGDSEFKIRTFERGVEDETLACGTGSVAAAISTFLRQKTDKTSFLAHAVGGDLNIHFDYSEDSGFTNIWLKGPAEFVFEGKIGI